MVSGTEKKKVNYSGQLEMDDNTYRWGSGRVVTQERLQEKWFLIWSLIVNNTLCGESQLKFKCQGIKPNKHNSVRLSDVCSISEIQAPIS